MNKPESSPAFRLDGFLKYVGVVATGGEAKLRIQGGEVKLNGETETRRRKQLAFGDQVEIDGESFQVELAPEDQNGGGEDPTRP